MRNQSNNRFAKGSGVYTCRVCGRKTRNTDPDATQADLCAQDWELSGLQNSVWDGLADAADLARMDELKRIIAAKGGTVR